MTKKFKSHQPTSFIRFLDENNIVRFGQCEEDQPKIGVLIKIYKYLVNSKCIRR